MRGGRARRLILEGHYANALLETVRARMVVEGRTAAAVVAAAAPRAAAEAAQQEAALLRGAPVSWDESSAPSAAAAAAACPALQLDQAQRRLRRLGAAPGPWALHPSEIEGGRFYWRMDETEDCLRARRRLKRNPTGGSRQEAAHPSSRVRPGDADGEPVLAADEKSAAASTADSWQAGVRGLIKYRVTSEMEAEDDDLEEDPVDESPAAALIASAVASASPEIAAPVDAPAQAAAPAEAAPVPAQAAAPAPSNGSDDAFATPARRLEQESEAARSVAVAEAGSQVAAGKAPEARETAQHSVVVVEACEAKAPMGPVQPEPSAAAPGALEELPDEELLGEFRDPEARAQPAPTCAVLRVASYPQACF